MNQTTLHGLPLHVLFILVAAADAIGTTDFIGSVGGWNWLR
jgi:hypothetical protein